MKKSILFVSIALIAFALVGATEFQEGPPLKAFQYQMNGSWLPDVHALHVGAKNYTEVKNLRPTSTGYETVEGYTKINTTLTDTPVNIHHFSKGSETHLVAKVNNAGTYELVQNTTTIPSQGDFSATALKTVASGVGTFSNGPRGVMLYADDSYNLIWGGTELNAGAMFVGDSINSLIDYTGNVSNDLTSETAIVGNAGDDASAVLLLHMEGTDGSITFTDDGETIHVVSPNGDTQIDTDFYKFGVSSGIFDGNGDYLSIPDHADFNYSTGLLTLDGQVMFSAITGQQMIYFQGAATNYVALLLDNDNGKLRFIVESSGTQLLHFSGTWAPTANMWYHWAVIRGWGGVADDWAITINGTAIATATASITMPNVAASALIGTASNTVLIDIGNTGHGFTMAGNATMSYGSGKFGTGGLFLDGTGDYASSADSTDWDILTQTNATVSLWVKHTDHVGVEFYVNHYEDINNQWRFYHEDGAGIKFNVISGGVEVLALTGGEITDTSWHHVALAKVGDDYGIYKDGTQIAHTNDSSTDTFANSLWIGARGGSDTFAGMLDEIEITNSNLFGAAPVAGLTDTISVPTDHETSIGSSTRLLLYCDVPNFTGWMDEYRLSKAVARWTATFTPNTIAYYDGGDYFYVASPLKLEGIKAYVQDINQTASTLAGTAWTGAGWSALSLTDGTASGGITLAQTGNITWTYSEDPKVLYINGITMYVYRFALSAGSASVYKITTAAPFQNIRDIWNEAPRTCTSFQASRSAKYEDYTFPVAERDSTSSSTYAATIGGLTATDHIVVIFDDRTMAVKFDMVSSLVNAADAQISDIQFWNGSAYTSVGYFNDGTLDAAADSSFSQSGVVSWNPPSKSREHRQDIFGVSGYAYKILIDGTLTTGTGNNGTSIDLVTGITSPLEITGYNSVGTYNGRALLINGNKIDYSQTDNPWIFNGVDTSDNSSLALYFGDDNDIVATKSIFNRYGSNLIEALAVFKKNSIDLLTGSQPYLQYADPFIVKSVSKNIGCAATMTLNSYQMEFGDGLRMSVLVWLDFSGPYVYNGADPQRIEGIENYFDPSSSTSINRSYIGTSWAYIDSVNDQWNLCFPVGASTTPNKWVVYDFKHRKWFEKIPSSYPTMATHVVDTNGARYNYGFLSTGQMLRLDNGQNWDGTAIAQSIKTGYISPQVIDELGFWTRSELRAVRLLSSAITEDKDVTVTVFSDGSLSANSLTIGLDSSGVISKNTVGSGNLAEKADFFQINFAASTSTNKWTPLAWGYKARMIRED